MVVTVKKRSKLPPGEIALPGLGGRISRVFDWLALATVRTVPDGKSCMKGSAVSSSRPETRSPLTALKLKTQPLKFLYRDRREYVCVKSPLVLRASSGRAPPPTSCLMISSLVTCHYLMRPLRNTP